MLFDIFGDSIRFASSFSQTNQIMQNLKNNNNKKEYERKAE